MITDLVSAFRALSASGTRLSVLNRTQVPDSEVGSMALYVATDDDMHQLCVEHAVVPARVEHDEESWLSADITVDGMLVRLIGPSRTGGGIQ